MSRIGKIPVEIPKGAKVIIEDGAVRTEGPKGKLSLKIPRGINEKLPKGFRTLTTTMSACLVCVLQHFIY